MDVIPEKQTLLDENRFQWQEIVTYLKETKVRSQDIAKIERLAIASPYALQQLHKYPQWIESLLRLEEFNLVKK